MENRVHQKNYNFWLKSHCNKTVPMKQFVNLCEQANILISFGYFNIYILYWIDEIRKCDEFDDGKKIKKNVRLIVTNQLEINDSDKSEMTWISNTQNEPSNLSAVI